MSANIGPCYLNDPDWGDWALPRSPRGLYVPVTQVMDSAVGVRRHVASVAQCAGLICKGDRWWAAEFDQVMTHMNFGAQWAPYINLFSIWDQFIHAYLALNAVGFISPGLYWDVMFAWHFDPTRANPWFVSQSRVQGPNTTTDLSTGATYPYNAAPWTHSLLPAYNLAISNNAAWGDVWSNPI